MIARNRETSAPLGPYDERCKRSSATNPYDERCKRSSAANPYDERCKRSSAANPNDERGKRSSEANPNDERGKRSSAANPNDERGKRSSEANPNDERTAAASTAFAGQARRKAATAPRLTAAALSVATLLVLSPLCRPAAAEPRSFFRMYTPEFKASVRLGHEMFVKFQCAKCHATHEGELLTKDIIAPNLILAKTRLRPEWMLRWLIDPQKLQAGTKMPNFFNFNEDDDFNPIYTDDVAHENYRLIVALRDYTMVIGTEMDPDYDPNFDPVAYAEAKAAAAAAAEAAAAAASQQESQQWNDYYGY